jgi:hypothetical protein
MKLQYDADFNPIVFRLDGRLIVFAGQLNEQGERATFFMDFDGKTFRHVYQMIDEGTNRPSNRRRLAVGTAHHLGSRKLSSPNRPINPVGGNRPRVPTEADNRGFRSSGK